jgi:hypothetical protein
VIIRIKKLFAKYWLITLLLLLSILPLLPASPLIQHTPPRDPGIFLYIGSRLLHGDVPYRNVWDDKPPMIFLINAFGLWISAGSRWGVWILEVFSSLAAVWLAFTVLKRSFGITAAALGILSGLTILLLTLLGGNYTEQYAIPFQFASIFLLVEAERREKAWPAFVCGIALGFIFFLRQNLISVGAAIAIYLVIRSIINHSWNPFRQLVIIILGAVSVSIAFLVYLAIQGALPGFWDGAFVYNVLYSNLGLLEHIKALGDTLQFFGQFSILLIPLLVWLLALVLLLLHGTSTTIKILRNGLTRWILLAGGILFIVVGFGANLLPGSRQGMGLLKQAAIIFGVILAGLAILQVLGFFSKFALPRLEKITYQLSPASASIIAIAVIWYPLEVGMVNLSGRSYLHYYMAICAICTVLYAFLANQIQRAFAFRNAGKVNIFLILVWSIGLVLTLIKNPINSMRVMYTPGPENSTQLQAVRYIEANTQPEDKVLVWGAEPVVNFLSQRSSPLRYPHVYPFYIDNYGGKALSAEILADILTKKPVLIIYTRDTPFVNITSDHTCLMPAQPLLAGMDDVMKAVCSNYHYAGNIGSTGWKVYHIDN